MKRIWIVLMVVVTVACAGMQKDCAKMNAGSFGSDWIVVQLSQSGAPFNCWKLRGAVVSGTEGGNVDWQDPKDGHLVHITGWENRVQVKDRNFASAAAVIGIDEALCDNGRYPSSAVGVR